MTSKQYFENINIDLYVSNKLMEFIRNFFVLTTYSHYFTRKHKENNNYISQQIPFSYNITDLKTIT
jgi:hypothetical protein